MKECRLCGVNKSMDCYYKHPKMKGGRDSKCKDCVKAGVKKNRENKAEYYKAYDAWRFKNDPRVKERNERYANTDRGTERLNTSKRAWINRNPDARAAHIMVGNAVRDGRLHKPENCSCCGNFTPSRTMHAHHHDYSAPLEVTWLCVGCHSHLHNSS